VKRTRQAITAAVLSVSVAVGAQSLFAQSPPGGGSSSPSGSGVPGSTLPKQDPSAPRQMEPTNPGKPAPTPPRQNEAVPGQGGPIPGQAGTIPEQMQQPNTVTQQQGVGGLSSDQIKRIQEALKAKGMNPGAISGIMDPTTQQALRDFQKANNLPVTGVLDPNTADKLGITANGTSTSQRAQDSTAPKTNKVVP
jgi:putative peptidoglycan binding protein